MAACLIAGVVAPLATGCSLPVSMPLSPFAETPDAELITGSIGPVVEENGMSARLGEAAWPAVRLAVSKALDAGDDGETFAWRHRPEGKAGTVTPIAAYFGADGEMCRRLTVTSSMSARIDVFLAEACRDTGGRWQIAPSADAA